MGDTIKHVCGNQVCWTRSLANGDTVLYAKDNKLKQSILMANPKWVDVLTNPFDDAIAVGEYNDDVMIAVLSFGHCLLAIDTELACFEILTANHEGKFRT